MSTLSTIRSTRRAPCSPPGKLDDQRDAHVLGVEPDAVPDLHSVLQEELAVVRRDDDHRVLVAALLAQEIEERAELVIDEGEAGVVAVDDIGDRPVSLQAEVVVRVEEARAEQRGRRDLASRRFADEPVSERLRRVVGAVHVEGVEEDEEVASGSRRDPVPHEVASVPERVRAFVELVELLQLFDGRVVPFLRALEVDVLGQREEVGQQLDFVRAGVSVFVCVTTHYELQDSGTLRRG